MVHYPVDSAIGFPNTCPLDSDLSSGWHNPAFEQPGPSLLGEMAGYWPSIKIKTQTQISPF